MQFVATAISCVSRDRLAPAGEEHTHDACTNHATNPFRANQFLSPLLFPWNWSRQLLFLSCSQSVKSGKRFPLNYIYIRPNLKVVRNFSSRGDTRQYYSASRAVPCLHQNSRTSTPSQLNAALQGSFDVVYFLPGKYAVHRVRCNLFQVCSSVYTVVLRG